MSSHLSRAVYAPLREEPVLSWIARALLIVAGFATSWFVGRDAPNFGFIQITVALMLFGLVVFVLAFWLSSWIGKLNRSKKLR